MKAWRLLFLVFCTVAQAQCGLAQSDPTFQFKFTNQLGPLPVGVRVAEQYDSSRPFNSSVTNSGVSAPPGPRPLQIVIWYPAEIPSGNRMTFGDYHSFLKTETSFGQPVEHGCVQDVIASLMKGTESLQAWSFRDAPLRAGKYPVVIYAPGLNGPNFENIELCEYLASDGYVVLASPSMGSAARRETTDLAGANAQAQDIVFSTAFAKTLVDADSDSVANIGYSWGGMAEVFAAAKQATIKALVSWEGSLIYSPELAQQARYVHPEKMTIPLLSFVRPEDFPVQPADSKAPVEIRKEEEDAPSILGVWTHGDLLQVRMLAMSISRSALFGKGANALNKKRSNLYLRTIRWKKAQ